MSRVVKGFVNSFRSGDKKSGSSIEHNNGEQPGLQQAEQDFMRYREDLNRHVESEPELRNSNPQSVPSKLFDVLAQQSYNLLSQRILEARALSDHWQQKCAIETQIRDVEIHKLTLALNNKDQEKITALNNLENKLQAQINRLVKEKADLVHEHRQDVDFRETQLRSLGQAKEQQLDEQKQRHQESVRNLRAEHDREQAAAHREAMDASKHAQVEQARLRREYEEKLLQQKHNHETERRRFLEKMAANQREHDSEIREQGKKHTEATTELNRAHRMVKEKMINEHKTQQSQMTMKLHESSEALLARDDEMYTSAIFSSAHLQRTPDEHIKAQFLNVIAQVEDLSRVEWREDRQIWQESTLEKLGQSNLRIVRKNIIQDFIWSTLLEHVFCSPFRLFGSAGLDLEKEWADKCRSTDSAFDSNMVNGTYTWPIPSIKTERWRYLTVHGCRETLRAHPSAYDARVHLKNDFNKNLVETIKKIDSFLKLITDTSSATMMAIKELLKKISNMWLEFGMNRCRLVIFLDGVTEPKSVTEKLAEAEKGCLQLVVSPGLRRYGNEKGEDLEDMVILDECDGKTVEYPPSTSV